MGQLRLGGDLSFAAQIVGTTSATTGTWRWSWSNPSIDEALTRRALEVQQTGRERGISALTSSDLDLDDVGDGHVVALVTSGLLDADAYYRGLNDAGEVYVLVDAPEVGNRRPEPIEFHAITVISDALSGLPMSITSAAVANYLRKLGLPVRMSGRDVRLDGAESTTFKFDKHGRLMEIRGTGGAEVTEAIEPSASPTPSGVPLRDWHDGAFESLPFWRDAQGEGPPDVLRRYQEGRHAWEKEASRAGDRRWPEMKGRLAALYEQVATPRPIEERDTSFGRPATRDPDRTRIVAVSEPMEDRVTINVEEDDPSGLLVEAYEVEAVLVNGEWKLDDRAAVYDDERIPGLL